MVKSFPETELPTPRPPEIEAAVRRRAEEIYNLRGRMPGHEVEDWLQAEADVMRDLAILQQRKPAQIVVRVHGVTYTGEYDSANCGGYRPGELHTSDPIRVRFEGEKMFVRRPNGTELEARIIRKSG